MTLKTIVTYLPDRQRAERLLKVAAPLARRHDAHLIGLHIIPRIPALYSVAAVELPASVIQQQQAAHGQTRFGAQGRHGRDTGARRARAQAGAGKSHSASGVRATRLVSCCVVSP